MLLRSREIARICALTLYVFSALTAVAGLSQAREEGLRWSHPRLDVQRFEAQIQPLSGGAPQLVSMGLPTPDAQGIYRQDLEVGDGDVEVSLRAEGPGGVLSDWTAAQLRLEDAPPPDPTVEPGAGIEIPPTAGAATRLDFADNPPGPVVSGWVDTTNNFSLSVDDTLFDVVSVGGNPMLHTASTASDVHSHAAGANQIRSNFEIRGRLAMDHPDASIGVTTYSGYPAEDVYYRIGRESGGAFRFTGRPGLNCSSEDSDVIPVAGEWIRFKIDVIDEVDQNRIRAKLWSESESEPSEPQIECVDARSDRPSQGTFGVWSGGPGNKYWDDFEAFQGESPGGGGGTAPPLPPVLLQIIPVTP